MKQKLKAGNVVMTIFTTSTDVYYKQHFVVETQKQANGEWVNSNEFSITDLQNLNNIITKILLERIKQVSLK